MDLSTLLLMALPMVCLALIAQWGKEHLPRRRIVIGFLIVLTCLILFIGCAVLVVGLIGSFWGESFGKPVFVVGIWLLSGAALAGLSLIPSVRTIVSRIMPADLDSTSRVVGLWIFILTLTFFIGYGANFDVLNHLSSLEAAEFAESMNFTPVTVLMQGLAFTLIALFGAGFPFKRSLREAAARLGLGRVQKGHWLWIGGFMVFAFVFGAVFSIFLNYFSGGTEEKIEQILSLMAGTGTKAELIILAAAVGIGAGISEELLFRGLLQPVFGIFFSAVLFASLHLQYGFTLVLVQLVIWAMALGYVKKKTNTTAAILAHGLYNFIAVLLTGLS